MGFSNDMAISQVIKTHLDGDDTIDTVTIQVSQPNAEGKAFITTTVDSSQNVFIGEANGADSTAQKVTTVNLPPLNAQDFRFQSIEVAKERVRLHVMGPEDKPVKPVTEVAMASLLPAKAARSGIQVVLRSGEELDGVFGTKPEGEVPDESLTPKLSILGALDEMSVTHTVRRQMAGIDQVFDRERAAHPDLKGYVVMKITVDKYGEVQSAELKEDDWNHTGAGAKVTRAVESWVPTMTFPNPKGGGIAIITYPFFFGEE